jgi:CDP-diacylglycerol--serine O-phosphatidyltransferase
MLKMVEAHFDQFPFTGGLNVFFGRAVFFAAVIYAMCAVIRLARFNVENKEEDESAHLSFAGLTSPPAAGLIVSMVIFQQDCLPKVAEKSGGVFRVFEPALVWILPLVSLIAGLLMVTRIPYPHVVNRILRGKKRFSVFLMVLFAGLLIIWNIQLAMVLGFCVFTFFGIIRWLLSPFFLRVKKEQKTDA